MALLISKDVGLTNVVSDSNPVLTDHPTTGSTVTVRLWLFNDNAAKRYENISIDPVDLVSTDESTWVQLAPDNAGSPGSFLAGGAALSMANISDSNVARPFWVKVTTPAVGDTMNKEDIKLDVAGREFAV